VIVGVTAPLLKTPLPLISPGARENIISKIAGEVLFCSLGCDGITTSIKISYSILGIVSHTLGCLCFVLCCTVQLPKGLGD